MTVKPQEILDFWFVTTPVSMRYALDPALDAEIRRLFLSSWQEGRDGALVSWNEEASSALALIILFDQFSRNMFRGGGEAFSTDALALETAKRAVTQGFDLTLADECQMFFYLPYMHSENLADQNECIRLCFERKGENPSADSYAVRHRDVIARFGRFPARNLALGRNTTNDEAAFLEEKPSGF